MSAFNASFSCDIPFSMRNRLITTPNRACIFILQMFKFPGNNTTDYSQQN